MPACDERPPSADGVARPRRSDDDGMVPRTKTVAALQRRCHPMHPNCTRPSVGSFYRKFWIVDLALPMFYWSPASSCNLKTLLEEDSCAIRSGALVAVGLTERETSAVGVTHPTLLLPCQTHLATHRVAAVISSASLVGLCELWSPPNCRPTPLPPRHLTALPLHTMTGTPFDGHLGARHATRWPLVLCVVDLVLTPPVCPHTALPASHSIGRWHPSLVSPPRATASLTSTPSSPPRGLHLVPLSWRPPLPW